MRQRYVNLTGHEINEMLTGLTIKKGTRAARAEHQKQTVKTHNGVPIYTFTPEKILYLPEPQEGVMYIVSSLTLNSVPDDRNDVVAPAKTVRDEVTKQPIGCLGFRTKDNIY